MTSTIDLEPCLFVGGYKDGQVLDTDGRPYWDILLPPKCELSIYSASPVKADEMTISVQTYRGHHYRYGQFDIVVYILSGLPASAAEGLSVVKVFEQLPRWLWKRRMALANKLWIAGMVFEHNIFAAYYRAALKHRLPVEEL